MNIVLQREILSDESTIGVLLIDGEHFCFTLEDVVRPKGSPKVYGKTAIPEGRYRVVITMSNRFKKLLPLLVDVPQFVGIRIHSLNTALESDGCIGVGLQKGVNSIGRSRAAMEKLMPILEAALQDGEVFIEIRNP